MANTSIPTLQTGNKLTNLQTTSLTSAGSATPSALTWTDVTDGTTTLSVSITPTLNTSTVMISGTLCCGQSNAAGNRIVLRLLRGATPIIVGDSAGSRAQASLSWFANTSTTNSASTILFEWVDSPATTSATTYKLQYYTTSTNTFYVNRGSTDSDANTTFRTFSCINAIEVLA